MPIYIFIGVFTALLILLIIVSRSPSQSSQSLSDPKMQNATEEAIEQVDNSIEIDNVLLAMPIYPESVMISTSPDTMTWKSSDSVSEIVEWYQQEFESSDVWTANFSDTATSDEFSQTFFIENSDIEVEFRIENDAYGTGESTISIKSLNY